jgi:HEAT repeat protein
MTEIRNELDRLVEFDNIGIVVPRHVAFHRLFERHGDPLIAALIECLSDEKAEVRHFAVVLLGEAGDQAEPAVPALIERLADSEHNVVVMAMIALKRLAQFARSAIPEIKRVLADTSDSHLRIVAAATLGKIDPTAPDSIPILVAALNDPESINRAVACEFLGERKHSAAMNTMKLFNDPDFVVRFAAAKTYSKWTGDWLHAVAVCVAILKDDNATNRAMATACLLSIRHYIGDHLDLLTMAMADCSWQARLDIEEVLAELRRQ